MVEKKTKKTPKKKPVRKSTVKAKAKKTVKQESVESTVKKIKQPLPAMRLYRTIAFGFIAVTIILLVVVVYLSLLKAEVIIFPNREDVSVEFIVDIVPEPQNSNEVSGVVLTTLVEQAKEFNVSTEGATEVEDKAGGAITVYNDSGTSQPLVSTTRFLTPEGILFRLDSGVTVPANSSVEAVVYADEPGVSGEVDPTSFTIPGLNETRQKYVYAESSESMTGGVKYISVVTADQLATAEENLSQEMIEAAKSDLLVSLGESNYSGQVFLSEVQEKTSNTIPGTESDTFTIEIDIRLVGVFYDESRIQELALSKLYEGLSTGKELVKVKDENLNIEIEKYNIETGLANLRVELEGQAIIRENSELLNKDLLIGLDEIALKARLESYEAVQSVEVEFFPFWVKRIPNLKDHIDIIIESVELD